MGIETGAVRRNSTFFARPSLTPFVLERLTAGHHVFCAPQHF
jgi:hypothetical protein